MNCPQKFYELPIGAYFHLVGAGHNHVLQKRGERSAAVVADNSLLWIPKIQPVVRIVTRPIPLLAEFRAAKSAFAEQVNLEAA